MAEEKVGYFCKTFRPDFDRLQLLLETFANHNPDDLTLTLSLPREHLSFYNQRFGRDQPNVSVIVDEDYCEHDLATYRGWHGQQICKMMSWNATENDHYAVIDSDCYFTRDVRAAELRPGRGKYVACGSTVRTVMKEGNDDLLRYIDGSLPITPALFPEPPLSRDCEIDRFRSFKDQDLDNPGAIARSDIPFKVFHARKWIFFQPCQIFSRKLLIRFHSFLRERSLTFGDLILISPWEYNWYGEFAVFDAFEDTEFRISPFLHFQSEADMAYARVNGFTEAKASPKFPFMAMAARHFDAFRFE